MHKKNIPLTTDKNEQSVTNRMENTAIPNSTLAIGRVSSPLDSFEVAESSFLRTNFCADKPALRQSAKRYVQMLKFSLRAWGKSGKLKILASN